MSVSLGCPGSRGLHPDTGVNLRDLVAADSTGAGLDLDAIFDYAPYVRYADQIIDRLGAIA